MTMGIEPSSSPLLVREQSNPLPSGEMKKRALATPNIQPTASTRPGSYVRVNREAAAAVMRETACRGLGGLIVIDFLRLSSKAARAALFAAMQEECAAAGLSVRPHGFTRAGLFEMTAERARLSLLEQMACRERTGPGGWRIRDESLAFALMRRVLAEAAADPGRPPRVTAAAKICLCLEGKLRSSWSAVAARSGARLVAGGADWPHDRIDITR